MSGVGGNSGDFLQSRFHISVLDCDGLGLLDGKAVTESSSPTALSNLLAVSSPTSPNLKASLAIDRVLISTKTTWTARQRLTRNLDKDHTDSDSSDFSDFSDTVIITVIVTITRQRLLLGLQHVNGVQIGSLDTSEAE